MTTPTNIHCQPVKVLMHLVKGHDSLVTIHGMALKVGTQPIKTLYLAVNTICEIGRGMALGGSGNLLSSRLQSA
jgi:hypothetical protein